MDRNTVLNDAVITTNARTNKTFKIIIYEKILDEIKNERLLKLLSEFKDEAGLKAEHTKLVTLEESFLKIHETEDVSHELLMELANEIEEIRNDIIGM